MNSFREGITAYRNARDWAKRQRDEAIRQANERATPPDLAMAYQVDGFGLAVLSESIGC